MQGEHAVGRAGTLGPTRAGSAIVGREGNGNHVAGMHMAPILHRRPAATGVPLRADHALRVPVNHEVVPLETGLRPGLPAPVAAGRAEYLDAKACLAGCEHLGVDVARVDELT